MSWLDIIILLPLLIGLIRGLMRGFVVELTAIVAILFGFIGTKIWGAPFAVWLGNQFAWPEAVCSVVAYALLFLGITLLLNILARLISKLFKAVNLGWLNRLFGAVLGVTKWATIVLFLVLCVHRLDDQFHFFKEELKQQSSIYTFVTPLSEKAWSRVKEEVSAYSDQLPAEITSKKQIENEQK